MQMSLWVVGECVLASHDWPLMAISALEILARFNIFWGLKEDA